MSSSVTACSENDLDKLLQKSRAKNKKLNITGILLKIDDDFLQVLEGEHGVITNLYEVIKEDERHHTVTLMSCENIGKRQFVGWSMGYGEGFSEIPYSHIQKNENFQLNTKASLVHIEGKKTVVFIESVNNSYTIEFVHIN